MAEDPTASVKPDEGAEQPTASLTREASLSERSQSEREQLAAKLVGRFAIWSGAAGLIPVPVVDIVTVAGLQLQMLRRISQVYNVSFSENRGKALIASLAGSLIPASSGLGAVSALKAVPIVGTLTAGLAMPVLSAGATYAIGKAFIQHFESGGTLLDFNPPDYREFVRTQKEVWDARRSRSAQSAEPPPTPAGRAEETATAGS
jgi:uncharacterized protein (DUF697 family)